MKLNMVVPQLFAFTYVVMRDRLVAPMYPSNNGPAYMCGLGVGCGIGQDRAGRAYEYQCLLIGDFFDFFPFYI